MHVLSILSREGEREGVNKSARVGAFFVIRCLWGRQSRCPMLCFSHRKGRNGPCDLTQEELGESLGVSNKTVSRWETGTYLPPVEMLQQLSDRYGVSINELLSGERLTAESYREKAEENIKSALNESAFTVEERLDFFKKKWRKDNVLTMVCCDVCWLVILLALKYKGVNIFLITFTAGLLLMAFYVVLYNRMMTYAESRVFDKVIRKMDPEWEAGMAEQRQDRWRPRGGFWMAVLICLGFVSADPGT